MLQVGVVEIHTYEYINVLCRIVHVFIYPSVGRVRMRACTPAYACVWLALDMSHLGCVAFQLP